jgi:ASC-1-like (ASCH) protein
MPLFMVKKQNFDLIQSERKRIEVRKGKIQKGKKGTFLSSKWMLKGNIMKVDEGKLTDIVNSSNFKQVLPSAVSLEEVLSHIEKLYGTRKGTFTAYHFELKSKKPKIIF